VDEGAKRLATRLGVEDRRDGVDTSRCKESLAGVRRVGAVEETVWESEWLGDGVASGAGASGTTRAVYIITGVSPETVRVLCNKRMAEE
jgi:hypothetical protein